MFVYVQYVSYSVWFIFGICFVHCSVCFWYVILYFFGQLACGTWADIDWHIADATSMDAAWTNRYGVLFDKGLLGAMSSETDVGLRSATLD